jgi:hypothetical protein
MDFNLSEEQRAIRDLSAQIFQGRANVERIKDIEGTEDRVDRQLWSELARANLLGVALPDSVGGSGLGLVELALYATAGIGPDDIQTAVIYDHFTPLVLPQLEEFGFCGEGEAKDFIKDGNIELGGRLPIKTNGGQLGEAYVHPRHERHRRSGPQDARYVGQSGAQGGARAGHRRHGRTDQRRHPGIGRLTVFCA